MSEKDNILTHRTLVFEGFSTSVSQFYALLEQVIAYRRIPGARVSRVFLHEGGLFGSKREYVQVRRKRQEFLISASAFGESFMVTYWLRKMSIPWRRWLFLAFFVCVFLDSVSERAYMAVINALACCMVPVACVLVLLFFVRKIPGVKLVVRTIRSIVGWGWRTLKPPSVPTLYTLDTTAAFQLVIPAVVEQAIQTLRNAQGLRALPAGELTDARVPAG